MNAVLYIHGKNGSAAESEYYRQFFPGCTVVGLEYQTFTPWETGREIHTAVEELSKQYGKIVLIANSIGAFFTMHADIESMVERAYLSGCGYGKADSWDDVLGTRDRAAASGAANNSHLLWGRFVVGIPQMGPESPDSLGGSHGYFIRGKGYTHLP